MPGEQPPHHHPERDVNRGQSGKQPTLIDRYHTLLERKFHQGLTKKENRELQSIRSTPDILYAPLYLPTLERLREITQIERQERERLSSGYVSRDVDTMTEQEMDAAISQMERDLEISPDRENSRQQQ